MTFKAYDILSSLVPGFLILLGFQNYFELPFDKDMVIPYTAIAFLLGFIINTLSSWLEDFYFYTWGGKPSSNLLKGKNIWKIHFYNAAKVKQLLSKETSNTRPSNDELFSIAMRYANGQKDSRVEDFNAMYAFSRALLTSGIFCSALILVKNYNIIAYYVTLLPMVFILWLRCKQRGYYYAKEVLDCYLKSKEKNQ